MGIVIGSCMSKETSAANINSPVYPPGRHNNIGHSSDGRESLRMLMSSGGVSYASAEHQQQQEQRRAISGPVPYAYIHDSSSHPLRGHHIPRRVVHGEWARGLRFPSLRASLGFPTFWHRLLASDSIVLSSITLQRGLGMSRGENPNNPI